MNYTAQDKINIINEYFQSNLSMTKFSIMKGLGNSTLSRWIAIYEKENPELFQNTEYIPVLSKMKEPLEIRENDIVEKPKIIQVINEHFNDTKITMEKDGIKLTFDIENLRNVLEVFK